MLVSEKFLLISLKPFQKARVNASSKGGSSHLALSTMVAIVRRWYLKGRK